MADNIPNKIQDRIDELFKDLPKNLEKSKIKELMKNIAYEFYNEGLKKRNRVHEQQIMQINKERELENMRYKHLSKDYKKMQKDMKKLEKEKK